MRSWLSQSGPTRSGKRAAEAPCLKGQPTTCGTCCARGDGASAGSSTTPRSMACCCSSDDPLLPSNSQVVAQQAASRESVLRLLRLHDHCLGRAARDRTSRCTPWWRTQAVLERSAGESWGLRSDCRACGTGAFSSTRSCGPLSPGTGSSYPRRGPPLPWRGTGKAE